MLWNYGLRRRLGVIVMRTGNINKCALLLPGHVGAYRSPCYFVLLLP